MKSNQYFESGFILGLYRILGVIAFLISLVACFSDGEEEKARKNVDYIFNPLRSINLYSVCLPIVAFTYDNQIVKIMGRKEHKGIKLTKSLIIILYWMIIMVTLGLYNQDSTITIEVEVYVSSDSKLAKE